jgi:D-beta-D-heptose 7-phosphate kinase/D-beta-D-heptose 1-phosphate adenosyltransferase
MPTPDKSLDEGQVSLARLVADRLSSLTRLRVLVVGDLMLDHYIWGGVERINPEAPVQILRKERETRVPGGASNVAHNIRSLGAIPVLVGLIGRDAQAALFRDCLRECGVSDRRVVACDRPTTVKSRVMSMGQQLLRIDEEDTRPVPAALLAKLVSNALRELPRCGAVILSDYAKGVVVPELIRPVLAEARRLGVPVLADPKGPSWEKYRGVDLLTPNQKEASQASGMEIHSEEDLRAAGRLLLRQCGPRALVVTRGAEGVAVLRPGRRVQTLPARAREVFDVAGAGDSFIAGLALGLAAGLGLAEAAALGNHCGGIVVAKVGVATVSPRELLEALEGNSPSKKIRSLEELKLLAAEWRARGRKVVFTNGCFDLLHPGHIRFLHQAHALGDLLIVGLNTDRSVRALKGPGRPYLPQEERAALLSALEVVDYLLLFDEPTPERALDELRPDILVKGRNIPPDQVVGREIVEAHGGAVRRLPILYDLSVSDIVGGAAGKKRRRPRPA